MADIQPPKLKILRTADPYDIYPRQEGLGHISVNKKESNIMKLRGLLTLLLGLFLLGCTHDSDIDTMGGSRDDGMATMTIDAILPNLAGTTRAVNSALGGSTNVDFKGDGHENGYALRIIAKAYGTGDYDGQFADEDVFFITKKSELNSTIKLDLEVTAGRKYNVYLWADYVKEYGNDGMGVDLHYDTSNLPTVRLKEGFAINDESRDALYGSIVWEAIGDKTFGATLTRPLAKLRMMATDADPKADKVSITYNGTLYNAINVATGEVSTSNNSTEHILTATTLNYTGGDDSDQLKTNQTVMVDYILVPSNGMTVDITAKFIDGNDKEMNALDPIEDIALKRGNLTTLRGEMLSGYFKIETMEHFLTLMTSGPIDENGKTYDKVRLDTDLDFTDVSETISPISLDNIVEFNGNGKTISNITVEGASLFTEPEENAVIKDLTIESIEVESTKHAGALFNELNSSITFEGVNIDEGIVTAGAGGAAGGIVGYVGRSTPTDRSTNITVTFTECNVNGVTATSDSHEGHYVGLLSGFDNNERLIFTSSTATPVSTRVVDYDSPYVDANKGAWLKDIDFSYYNGWLGDETYYRGWVEFDGNRLQIKWDGERTIDPLKDGSTILIYSPFDLANLQKQNATSVKFKTNVDLGGDYTTAKNEFNPIRTITNLDGEGYTLYNLYVDMVHDGTGAAFIQTSSGTTTHKNLTFDGAYIKNVHNTGIQTPAYGVTNDGGAGNAYAGTLVVAGAGTKYLAENIHVKNSTVYAVCKMGGIMGRATANDFDMINCSVDKCTIENYNPKVPNYYAIPNYVVASYTVNGLQWWHTCGEAGGLIGFVQAPYADIQGCAVTNTNIYCVGQPNKNVAANVYKTSNFNKNKQYVSGQNLFAKGYTKIAGRHFNQFIGNVVSQRGDGGSNYVVNITDYIVKGNYYGSESNRIASSSTNSYNHNYGSGYCEVVGCPYFVGVEINPIGLSIGHVMHHAGTLYFKAKETDSTTAAKEATVTEADSEGDSTKWIGGDFFDWGVGILLYYPKSEYPNVNEIEGALENQ